MDPSVKCLLHKHETLSLGSLSPYKTCPRLDRQWGGDKQIPEAHWPANQTHQMSFMFRVIQSQKTKVASSQGKISNLNLGPACTHVSTYKHIYAYALTTYIHNIHNFFKKCLMLMIQHYILFKVYNIHIAI